MQKDTVLIIFTKNPEKGKVKTRLAEVAGDQKALDIYKKLLDYTRHVTKPLAMDKQVWYSGYVDDEDGWNPGTFRKKLQRGKDLGERMKNAFAEAFREGYRQVLIIGSDCAELTPELIREARMSFERYDVVIGPSVDGGYYLLGMKTFLPGLFEDIAWSTSEVLKQTIRKIKRKKLSLYLLPELNDVDDEQDWNEVKNRF